ncbi:MAG: hypothetical protein K9G39_01825 [Chlorobium sp.]|uniref:hypothetical protein n=1 Tax=Chlorobium sp. TaxID=1095 RepID=UPI0025BA7362|nr:hypothetical protein [Chlorobium sp.]MCF8382322.1 hypothetical protein [Chlorobium sp.]
MLFGVFTVISVVLIAVLYKVGKPLVIPEQGVSLGILDMELPVTFLRADSILSVWERHGVVDFGVRQTLLDFLFLMCYPVALSLLCMRLAGNASGFMATLGIAISWAVLLCTPLDAFENVLILLMLGGNTAPPFPELTTVMAVMKFSLIGSALLCYPLLNFLQKLMCRFRVY